MKKIFIVTEQTGDIFSEYLQGRGIKVSRLNPKQIRMLTTEQDQVERILTVNLGFEEAIFLKELFPNAKIMAVSGGHEQFTATVYNVYGEENYDPYPFGDWPSFEEIIFSGEPRPEPKLIYLPEKNRFKVNKNSIEKKPESNAKKFGDFIEAMVYLSQVEFTWMNNWIVEIGDMRIPVDFSYKKSKKIHTVVLPLKENEHLGLPLFKKDEEVSLCDLSNEVLFSGTVVQITDQKMFVLLEKHINRKELENVKSFRPILEVLSKRMKFQKELMDNFSEEQAKKKEEMKNSDFFFADSPIDYLANPDKQINVSRSNAMLNKPFSLSKKMKFLLRDTSQMEAMGNVLGPDFFSLVRGPAATGKTTWGSWLTNILIQNEKPVIMVSHTHLAVDTFLLKATDHIDPKNIFRIGNNLDDIMPEIKSLHIDVSKKRKGEEREEWKEWGEEFDSTGNSRVDELLEMGEGFLIGCTIDSFYLVKRLLKKKQAIVIIEEASRGYFRELLQVINFASEKVIMIGDDQQLGNMRMPEELRKNLEGVVKENALSISHPINSLKLPKSLVYYYQYGFFNSLIELGYFSASLLKVNRRSLKNICDMVSEVFYNGELVCGLFDPRKDQQGLLVFYDMKNVGKAVDSKEGTSSFNITEVNFLVKKFMQRAVNVIKNKGRITDLVTITSYSAQVGKIKEKLRKHLIFAQGINEQVDEKNIDQVLEKLVITVDKIQGGQRPIIFLSMVKSNKDNDIGFNNDVRRIRVACTRAEREMLFICNSQTFLNCGYLEIEGIFRKMISFIKKRGIYTVLKER